MKKISHFVDLLQRIAASPKFRVFVLGLFVAQAVFLVFAMHSGLPPDEDNQMQFIEYYAEHSISPIFSHQTPTYNLGDVTRQVDYVYDYSMSLVMRVSPLSHHDDVYIIRLISVALALLTFIMLLRILRIVGVGRATGNLSLLAVTNLPMVLMMSSAVNNDVTVWLGTIAGVYFLLRLWREHHPNDAMVLLIIAVFGGLVKRTLFPVCLIFGVTTIVMVVRYWPQLRAKIRRRDWRLIVLGVVFILGVGLFVERVGGNIVRYHTIVPTCTQVQGANACKVFWQYQRKLDIASDNPAAMERWLGDTAVDTVAKSPVSFVPLWTIESYSNIVDVQTDGWHHHIRPALWISVMLLIAVLVTTAFGVIYDARRVKHDMQARWRLVMVGLATLIVVSELIVNYATYLHDHIFGLALNGRYILPAVILLAGLNFAYGRKLFGKTLGTVLAIAVIVCIIAGSGLMLMVQNPQLFTDT
ncbi:MAG TPA: glycosyltransferase family 39 protein [Candidatus Saccharimonadaceae bacterium]|nr:glycosyltransferase family 39 protein [Candidatus Saccharimonadaceae bacterium]